MSNLGEICYYTPFRAGFLFNGGGCEQTTSDLPGVSCKDKNLASGPPPTENGARSFIVVTDDNPGSGYRGHLYFRGFVNVGEFYHIERPKGYSPDQYIH